MYVNCSQNIYMESAYVHTVHVQFTITYGIN